MKIKICEVKSNITLPCLMKHRQSSKVVLFVREHAGFVVQAGGDDEVGAFREDWRTYKSTSVWEALPSGTVVELIQE